MDFVLASPSSNVFWHVKALKLVSLSSYHMRRETNWQYI